VRVGEVLVTARRPDLSLAIGLAEEASHSRVWYGLGRREPGPLRLIVVRGAAPLDSMMGGRGPSWGAGYALPGTRTVVVRADAGDPHRILLHELAHLALHQAVRVRVPLWFDEGYAAVAAGEWNRFEVLQLNLTVARGAIPGFFELDRSLRASESTAQTAYALAASAVAMLARRHPEHSLEPLLSRLAAGEGFDAAVLATTGSRSAEFEEEWRKDVRSRFGLVVWAIAGGFWLIIGGAVIWGYWYRRRRDRPRRLALDQGWVVLVEPEVEAETEALDEPGPAP
jgi:hypothetical protein